MYCIIAVIMYASARAPFCITTHLIRRTTRTQTHTKKKLWYNRTIFFYLRLLNSIMLVEINKTEKRDKCDFDRMHFVSIVWRVIDFFYASTLSVLLRSVHVVHLVFFFNFILISFCARHFLGFNKRFISYWLVNLFMYLFHLYLS